MPAVIPNNRSGCGDRRIYGGRGDMYNQCSAQRHDLYYLAYNPTERIAFHQLSINLLRLI